MPGKSSLLGSLLSLPAQERARTLASLTEAEAAALLHDWHFWARPEQLPPAWDWFCWVILAGRGWGKTRTGAETVRQWVKEYPLVNLIGATADDARDIMILGESGILAICPPSERPLYVKSERRLDWPNGAKSLIFTADEPERLRGKQHMKLWADEVGAWRYAEAWDQAKMGLRLGDSPQAVVTTTPRPIKIVRDLIVDKRNHVTRGSTFDNRGNLAPGFFSDIVARYEGTRLGRQELYAEVLEDVEGALWQQGWIDAARLKRAPGLQRIVVAVDPAVTHGPDSDQTGIAAAGLGEDGQYYVLHGYGYRLSPDGWARRALDLYDQYQADRIIAERNNGGEMVEATIRNVRLDAPLETIVASRGKAVRAEPIAALYEQGRVHHVGLLPELEAQMCAFPVASEHDDMVDALVYALTALQEFSPTGGIFV